MPGGLLNLVSYGSENVILNGNPSKTFFSAVYKKYTNFGLQRFRLHYEGQRTLSFDTATEFVFKVPRYAELLWDTYVVLNLPDIWSPLYYRPDIEGHFVPYEFQWIREVGSAMIRWVTIYSGGSELARYSGEWMSSAIERDEGPGKKELFSRMTGNTPELYDPAKAFTQAGRANYPTAIFDPSCVSQGPEPSIRGRKLYIPLMAWFCYSSKMALPLIALQYQEVFIKVEFRPVSEIFTILDVQQPLTANTTICPPVPALNPSLCPPPLRKSPNPVSLADQLWHFIQPPTDISANISGYLNKRNDWNTDIHLIATYVFLGNAERRQIAASNHNYLVKTQFQYDFFNATGSQRVNLPSKNLVSSYMFRFRRSDVNLRNEWSNYTNWAYHEMPYPPKVWDPSKGLLPFSPANPLGLTTSGCMGMGNQKNILMDLGILCGSEYRENVLDAGVYNYLEKWHRTSGLAKDGLYVYNFCIDSNRLVYQPSGAQNTNKWEYVTFEYNTIQPPGLPPECVEDIEVLCDEQGAIIGVRKDLWKLNQYNYDMRVFEERYNMVTITSGRVGLLNAR